MATTGYRFGVWGACLPSQRRLIAGVLSHNLAEFQRRLDTALEAYQAAVGAGEATDAA